MQQNNKSQYADFIIEAIGVMSVQDKPALLEILQRNGSLVTDESTEAEILDASIKAIRDNKNFRNDIQEYLTIALQNEANSEDKNFANAVNPVKPKIDLSAVTKASTKGQGWSKVKAGIGNFFGAIFTKENISTGIGLGMGYLGTKLNANAQRGSNQQAIDYERAKAEASAQEAKRLEAEGLLAQMKSTVIGTDGKTKKWVLPVVIISGVAVVGTILYFALRKRQ